MNRATPPTGWVRNPDGTLGWTWNPITGCLNHINGLCKGGGFPCYAYKLAHGRLRNKYLNGNGRLPVEESSNQMAGFNEAGILDPFYPRFWEDRLGDIPTPWQTLAGQQAVKPRGIFVCDMGDLFGVGVPEEWTRRVLTKIGRCSEHRFYLLTKQPVHLIKFSPFPDNAWVGVTATNFDMSQRAISFLKRIEAKVKYVSYEPLLEKVTLHPLEKGAIDWLIIGACTGTKEGMAELVRQYPHLTLMRLCIDVNKRGRYIIKWTAQPPIEWLHEIVEAADKAGIKVFLKDNLDPLLNPNEHRWAFAPNLNGGYSIRQEMPK